MAAYETSLCEVVNMRPLEHGNGTCPLLVANRNPWVGVHSVFHGMEGDMNCGYFLASWIFFAR